MRFRIGTRGSKLAMAQAESVQKQLAEAFPEHIFEIVIVKTTGDRAVNVPMQEIGTKGIFTMELEEMLLSGTLDLAVHSMKDMPSELPGSLTLAKVWEREDPRDALILREKKSLEELPKGAVIASGSLRRKYQLLKLRPDIQVVDIRGNIDTRIRKMEEQRLDGIVLAAAGLKRLHIEERITRYFEYDEMIPAPAQGAIAIEVASGREDVLKLLQIYEDEATDSLVRAERHFLSIMGGGCHQPIGAIGEMSGKEIRLRVMYGEETGEKLVYAEAWDKDPVKAAEAAADEVRCALRQTEKALRRTKGEQ